MTIESSDASIVLASASPRRRALLRVLGTPFSVSAMDVDESVADGEVGLAVAKRLAATKALAGAAAAFGAVVLAADSVVVLEARVLGKPGTPEEARAMLSALRGRSHSVITALAIARDGQVVWQASPKTRVFMRDYSDAEIHAYIQTGSPFDKAGGYAVQDRGFCPAARVEGCYPNVVGLPLCEVARGLRTLGIATSAPPDGELNPPCALCAEARRLDV